MKCGRMIQMGILSMAVVFLLGGCGKIPAEKQTGLMERVEIMDIQEIFYAKQESYVPAVSSYILTRTEEGTRVTLGLGYSEEEYVCMEDADLLDRAREILEKNGVGTWNGFHETDPTVLDGSGFSLSVLFADGTRISASGNNCFPENYASFRSELEALVTPVIEQWEKEQQ